MPDKWQEINLRLDAELAHALREMKRGHDESLAEVVLRVLRKTVRQNPGNRGMPEGRSSGTRAGRAAFTGTRTGKSIAREDRGRSRGAAKGRPLVTREVADGDTWGPAEGQLEPARGPARTRPPRPFPSKGGKVFRPQPADGGAPRPRRDFADGGRSGGDGERRFRGKDSGGKKRGRMTGRRKAKGRRLGR